MRAIHKQIWQGLIVRNFLFFSFVAKSPFQLLKQGKINKVLPKRFLFKKQRVMLVIAVLLLINFFNFK